jgi:transposase
MIRGGFLDPAIRADLIALVRDGKAETRLTRRANALLLLDDGMSCEAIAKVLYLDDDTIRYWYKLYGEKGLNWLADFGYKGRACELTVAQQDALKNWVSQTLPRTTTIVGEWIEKSYGVSYTRSALIKLLQRIEVEYCKPKLIPRKLDPAQQQAFIANYENLLNNLGDDEAVLFADAVHPTHEARPAGCWAPKDAKVALEQTSGRQRLNIHGAIDLETGATRMIEATTIDALSTIALLMAISLMYPRRGSFTSLSTMPGTTMPCSFRNGWQDRGAGSGFITFRATARTLIRSSACGD